MIESKSFLQELDEAVSRGTAESRAKALWYATDALIVGRFTEDEIWTFGEVIGRLADAIEVAARATCQATGNDGQCPDHSDQEACLRRFYRCCGADP